MDDGKTDVSRLSERSKLLPLIERITDLMTAGDEDACLQLIADNDEYASELQSLMPSMRIMQRVQTADASGVGSAPQTISG